MSQSVLVDVGWFDFEVLLNLLGWSYIVIGDITVNDGLLSLLLLLDFHFRFRVSWLFNLHLLTLFLLLFGWFICGGSGGGWLLLRDLDLFHEFLNEVDILQITQSVLVELDSDFGVEVRVSGFNCRNTHLLDDGLESLGSWVVEESQLNILCSAEVEWFGWGNSAIVVE